MSKLRASTLRPLLVLVLPVAMGTVALAGATTDVDAASWSDSDRLEREHGDHDDDGFSARAFGDPDDASGSVESEQESGSNFPKIIAACIGVLFGGVIAAWQIRAMKKR